MEHWLLKVQKRNLIIDYRWPLPAACTDTRESASVALIKLGASRAQDDTVALNDEELNEVLLAVLDRTQARADRQQQTAWLELREDSVIVQEDDMAKPYRISAGVRDGIITATEAIHAHRTHVVARIRYPGIPFVLARIAIESAANVVWTLNPADSNERMRRSLLLQLSNINDFHKFVEKTPLDAPTPPEEHRDTVQQIAKRSTGMPITGRELSDGTATARISEASAVVSTEFSCLLAWVIGSGFAHGRPWVSRTILGVQEEIELGDGQSQQRRSSRLQEIVWAITCAEAMLSKAIQLFEQRGAEHPDATEEQFRTAQGSTLRHWASLNESGINLNRL